MRVLLINPNPIKYYKSTTCPLGLLSIATYLKDRGHIVSIIDSTVKHSSYKKVINNFSPDVVGVSVISYKSVSDAIKVSKIAHDKNLPVIWGGPLVSVIPEIALKHKCVDYVIIGEGEITFDEFLGALSRGINLNGIDGLAYKDNNKTVINQSREFADLADFPVLDWSLVNPADYFQSLFAAKKMLYLYSAKGCPGQCKFCFNKSFNQCVYRKRPFEYCIEEIKYLSGCCEVDGIHFADELWCRNKKEMEENCEKLRISGKNIVWGCNAKIGTYEKEDFKLMFNSGCRWMFFGVESGSETIQKDIQKGISIHKVEETINNCADAGIVPVTSFIIGFPDETPEQILETVTLAKKIPRAMYDFNFFFPLIGSEMCDQLVAQGRYKTPESLEELAKLIPTEKMQTNFSNIPKKDLKVIRAFFLWSSFARKGTSTGSDEYSFSKKVIADAMKRLSGRGMMNFFVSFAADAITFSGILSSLLFHPFIRHKYKLYHKNTQVED